MLSRILFGILGVALFAAFVAPVLFKIREVALAVVILLGLLPAIVDTFRSARRPGD